LIGERESETKETSEDVKDRKRTDGNGVCEELQNGVLSLSRCREDAVGNRVRNREGEGEGGRGREREKRERGRKTLISQPAALLSSSLIAQSLFALFSPGLPLYTTPYVPSPSFSIRWYRDMPCGEEEER
jgi:hypothetical protein